MQRACENGNTCLGCGGSSSTMFLDLGRTPLANAYLQSSSECIGEQTYPLAIKFCDECYLVQLAETVPPARLFSDYAYFSSYSDGFLEHSRRMAKDYIDRFGLGVGSRVLEVASNDGYLLQHFKARDITVLGIEPAGNIARAARNRGIPTMESFFEPAAVPAILNAVGQTDLVVGNNVLAHVPEINGFLSAAGECLKPGAAAVFEFPYVRDLVEKVEFDTIYHEHVFYYSLSAIRELVGRAGLELWDVSWQQVHGGSLRVFLQHPGARPIEKRIDTMLQEEERIGLTELSYYASFGQQVERLRNRLRALLDELRRAGKRVAAYGAPAKGNTLLNYCEIGRNLIEFTVDRSPHKQGMLLPGSHLPILPPDELLLRMPDYTVILPWNIASEIIEQQTVYLEAGGKFIVPVPEPRVIEVIAH
ncbi:MAG: methyltransferase domain-containing protein [Candidatus Binataceae bacterium]